MLPRFSYSAKMIKRKLKETNKKQNKKKVQRKGKTFWLHTSKVHKWQNANQMKSYYYHYIYIFLVSKPVFSLFSKEIERKVQSTCYKYKTRNNPLTILINSEEYWKERKSGWFYLILKFCAKFFVCVFPYKELLVLLIRYANVLRDSWEFYEIKKNKQQTFMEGCFYLFTLITMSFAGVSSSKNDQDTFWWFTTFYAITRPALTLTRDTKVLRLFFN